MIIKCLPILEYLLAICFYTGNLGNLGILLYIINIVILLINNIKNLEIKNLL